MTKKVVKYHKDRRTKKIETKDKEWVPTPEAKAWVREIMQGPKIKELDDRLRRVERMLFKEEQ